MNSFSMISLIVAAPCLVVSILLFIICGFFFLECLFSSRQSPERFRQNDEDKVAHTKLAVVIPAHNEANGISKTIEAINPQLRPQDCLLVVADNCNDDTALIARQLGANVIERQSVNQLGKGYALEFGIQHLRQTVSPDIVIFVDADCSVDRGSIDSLASQALQTNRPVQGIYLMEKPQEYSLKASISAFAFKVKNLVRPLGLANLGQPCLLTGTGIAMPWQAVQSINFATSSIVEDMRLGLDLAVAGYAPMFNTQAKVMSRLPEGEQASTTQRTRWEHGHLQIVSEYVPCLLRQALAQRRLGLLVLALEIAILPLSLLLMVTMAMFIVSTIIAFILGIWLPAFIAGLALLSLGVGIVIAWRCHGRSDITLRDFLAIPSYVLWKIPLYFRYLVKPERDWIRTERNKT
jgi:cellulose synthase/poly-beta-1,6-N-acetylglucosamine synthase-like glycosyltransferase